MTVLTSQHGAFSRPSTHRRRSVRYVAATVSAVTGALYLVLTFLVADAESVPGATDGDTYGGYLFLAIPFVAGAVVLLVADRRALWAVGAAVQVLVIALFVLFGIGVFGPGVFEYEALSALPMELWAAAVTGLQVVLLGLLAYLALTPARPHS